MSTNLPYGPHGALFLPLFLPTTLKTWGRFGFPVLWRELQPQPSKPPTRVLRVAKSPKLPEVLIGRVVALILYARPTLGMKSPCESAAKALEGNAMPICRDGVSLSFVSWQLHGCTNPRGVSR